MTTMAILAVPSILLTLALEVSEDRMRAYVAGLDGGIAISLGALALHLAGAI